MFRDVLRFELHYLFRRPAVYVGLVLFFLFGFMAIASDTFQSGRFLTATARNSPYDIVRLLASISVAGLVLIAGFVATAVNRDRELGVHELFFATPVSKSAYLGGRFAGSLIATFLAVSAAAAAMALASAMPFLDQERLVAFDAVPYVYALGVFVLPNLLLAGAILFSVATLTRRVLFAYVALVAMIALWIIARRFMGDIDSRWLGSIIDPFGIMSFRYATRYWTVAERNTALVPLSGSFILNRVLWTSVGVGFLVFTWTRFRMTVVETVSRLGRRGGAAGDDPGEAGRAQPVPMTTPIFTARTWFLQWAKQTRIEIGGVLTSVPFMVMLLLANVMLVTGALSEVAGTRSYPLTRIMVSEITGTFELFLVLVLLIYAGQLVWRERAAGMHEIHSVLPVPDWVPVAAKLSALAAVSVVMLAVAALATIAIQLAGGHVDLEPGVYLRGLFVVGNAHWLLIAALAIAVQAFTPKKIVGFFVVLAVLETLEWFPEIGLGHHLNLYSSTPEVVYSDMNGFGHFVRPIAWFSVYWGFLAAALLVVATLFWVRTTDPAPRGRWREARRRLTRARMAALAVALVGFVATGAWIFYNTNVLNPYLPEKEISRLQAATEERYKQYEGLPQPHVTDIALYVDIYPEERRVEVRGDLRLVNKTDAPIEELHVHTEPVLEWDFPSLAGETVVLDDTEVGFRIYRLAEPLLPGEALNVAYTMSDVNDGFVNHDSNTKVVENGTFFSNFHCVPHFGYAVDTEIEDPTVRRRHGLPPRDRMAAVDDPVARMSAFDVDSDWITYEATISTSEDQIAVTAGYLEREWSEDGRRHFRYRMDRPIQKFFPIVSGRYEVARDSWNDVAIEIFHHPRHAYNVGRMIESVQKSLDYFTANFSPYQHRQVRILEFPRYRTFAQSFPTTIPYSEDAHFVGDVRDPENLDMVFYITAHEVAHQWWAHQVVAARVQGSTFIEESLAQYSALMVMEKEFGRDYMKRFLEHELDRYLLGRGGERHEEMPLVLVEDQGYIHYRKGSLAMYALRDYIGEEAVNAALRAYIDEVAFQEPPYTNSLELLSHLREATPERYRYLIEDLFETITLYDNRVEEATVEETGDGRYRVRLAIDSRKLRADGKGVETEIPHADWIEVGVYGEETDDAVDERPLYLEKHRLASGNSEIEIVVDEKPARAGIDPRHLLIDREPGDNVKPVSG